MKKGGDARTRLFGELAAEISKGIMNGSKLGLGSGTTVGALLPELAKILRRKRISIKGIPTSMQIQIVAENAGIEIAPMAGTVEIVVDGADQVDRHLNLIKGGGGALMKEKVLISSARKTIILADRSKFVERLGANSVRVPVEVSPFARDLAKREIGKLGGVPKERFIDKGYPYFTENGNIILDSLFKPISNPTKLEGAIKCIPGVVEVGIFTMKPITVYRISESAFQRLKA